MTERSDISGIWLICVLIPYDLIDRSRKNVLLTFPCEIGEQDIRAEPEPAMEEEQELVVELDTE